MPVWMSLQGSACTGIGHGGRADGMPAFRAKKKGRRSLRPRFTS